MRRRRVGDTSSIAARILWTATILGTLVLGSCDDLASRLKKAVDSLSGYQVDSPPNASWKLVSIRAVGDEKVVIRIKIDPGTEVAFGAIGRIQQSRISQRACPSAGSKVWSILDKELQSLWLEMEGRSGVIVETLCKL